MTSRLINFELNFYRIRMVFTVGSKRGSDCFHFTPDLWVLPEKTLLLSYHQQSKMLLKALWREKTWFSFSSRSDFVQEYRLNIYPSFRTQTKVRGDTLLKRVKALEGTLPNSRREKKRGNIKWCKKNKTKKKSWMSSCSCCTTETTSCFQQWWTWKRLHSMWRLPHFCILQCELKHELRQKKWIKCFLFLVECWVWIILRERLIFDDGQ